MQLHEEFGMLRTQRSFQCTFLLRPSDRLWLVSVEEENSDGNLHQIPSKQQWYFEEVIFRQRNTLRKLFFRTILCRYLKRSLPNRSSHFEFESTLFWEQKVLWDIQKIPAKQSISKTHLGSCGVTLQDENLKTQEAALLIIEESN